MTEAQALHLASEPFAHLKASDVELIQCASIMAELAYKAALHAKFRAEGVAGHERQDG